MNLTQLRAFVMVVDQGSFSSAARAMHLSQPAVTMQVQSLEADLGARLLDRKYRRVDLTEAGAVLLPIARRIMAEVEQAQAAVAETMGTVTGHLVLCASTTPGQYVLPRLLGRFLRRFPDVGVSLEVMDSARVVESVATGEAQIGMTGAETSSAAVQFQRLGKDEVLLVAPPDHEFARGGRITVKQLESAGFIMREVGSGTRLVAEQVLREAGVDPEDLSVLVELGTGEAVLNAVEGGLGVGLVSRWVAEKALATGRVESVSAPGFPASRPLFVVTPKGALTRAAEEFLGYLEEELGTAEE